MRAWTSSSHSSGESRLGLCGSEATPTGLWVWLLYCRRTSVEIAQTVLITLMCEMCLHSCTSHSNTGSLRVRLSLTGGKGWLTAMGTLREESS